MKAALALRNALSPWVLFLVSIPSVFAGPLTESSTSPDKFLPLLVISLFTQVVSISFLLLFAPIYRKGRARWWYTPLLAAAAGAIKGWLTWLTIKLVLNGNGAFEGVSLESRLIVSSLTWMVFLSLFIAMLNNVLKIGMQNHQLRAQISEARKNSDVLEQQLDWLTKARISGLSHDLAKDFVQLAKKLNTSGAGPKSYQDIAAELRAVAKNQVRTKSANVWGSATGKQLKLVWSEVFNTRAKLFIAIVIYGFSTGIYSLRLYGLGSEFLQSALGTGVLTIALIVSKNRPPLQHLAPISAALIPLFYFVKNPEHFFESLVISMATLIWSELSILIAIAWPLAVKIAKEQKNKLENSLDQSEAEIEWLARNLESLNYEIAKYLHAILQTRLMSQAMRIEQGAELNQKDIEELEFLLTQPMSEFKSEFNSVSKGLEDLRENWRHLVEISLTLNCKDQVQASSTIQVIREAVVNSVRHGMSDEVKISILDSNKIRVIKVEDNGIGPKNGVAGLGSRIFASLCSRHKLERTSVGGSVFIAEIPL